MKSIKSTPAVIVALFVAGTAFAADVAPTNQLNDAISKLKMATNYSWTTTVKIVDAQFDISPVKGQAGNDGYARISQDFNGNTTDIVLKGDKVVSKTDDGWTLIGDDAGFGTLFASALARNGAAANEAAITLKDVKELKTMDDGTLGGDFTSDGATDMMTFGPRRAAGATNAFPAPTNAKGSVKFWIKDGMLTKFESHLTGTVSFGGNDNDQDQTRTVEISDVNTTKLDIPDDAKKALDAKPQPKADAQ